MAVGRNDYFERKEARIERLREKSEKMKAESVEAFSNARKIQNSIPLGQPILIGHHSEKRSKKDRDLSDEKAEEINKRIDEDYSFNKKPAPSYILSNLNAMIKSTEKRLEQLKELDEMEYEEIEFDNCTVISNDKTNRVEMHFGYKPDEDVRSLLKRKGFKWSRNNGCWQRLRNKNALYIATNLAKEIDEM